MFQGEELPPDQNERDLWTPAHGAGVILSIEEDWNGTYEKQEKASCVELKRNEKDNERFFSTAGLLIHDNYTKNQFAKRP